MTIDTITAQCFIAVAETGSFTKASQRIGRSQSAVSQQISKLENLLDKELFKRGKTLSLTNEGEIFLSYAKQIFKLHREALEYFKEPELKGEVRFGIPEDFASVFLYDVLTEFVQIHPRISLHIECDLSLNLFDKFQKNKLDLVVVKMHPPKEMKLGVELPSENLSWVGDSKNLNKSKSLPLVLSPKPCLYRESAIKALEKKNIKWHIAFSSHSYAGTIAATKAGLGFTVLPNKMIPKELSTVKSNFLPKLENSHVSLLKLTDNNKAVNSFEEFVIKHLSKK